MSALAPYNAAADRALALYADLPSYIQFYKADAGATVFSRYGKPLAHVRPGYKPRLAVKVFPPAALLETGYLAANDDAPTQAELLAMIATAQRIGTLPGMMMVSKAGRWLNSSVAELRRTCLPGQFTTPYLARQVRFDGAMQEVA